MNKTDQLSDESAEIIPFDFGDIGVFGAAKSIETTVHPYLTPYTYKADNGYIAVIPNGSVWGASGAVILPNGMPAIDLSPEYDGENNRMLAPEEHPALCRPKAQEQLFVHGTAAVLTFCGSHNYFHWLYDVLPRLGMLQELNCPYEKIIMNPNPHRPFVEETLSLLEIPDTAIIRTNVNLEIQADQLIAPSLMMNAHYPPWTTACLRRFFLSKRDTAFHTPERIYISRRKASFRQISNEEEIIRCLEKYGFVSVCLEDWSFAQQIQLFASAKVIVGPHGAGLANLAFCSQGTQVIEIFHIRHVIPTYWMISNHNKLDYYMLYGQEQGTDPGHFSGLEHYSIDINRLEQTLDLANLTRGN